MLKKPLKDLPFGHMVTSSGTVINLFDPDPNSISILDIASSLAKTCRFGGNINVFYSVAQHSCLVAWLSPSELHKAAILHDASETYCGDVIRPLKKMLGTKYQNIEERLQKAIFSCFNVEYDSIHLIKEYDDLALEMEEKALFNNNKLFQDTIKYQSQVWASRKSVNWWWDFRFAQQAYLETFFTIQKPFSNQKPWTINQNKCSV
jgi:hypothetical protein